MAIKEITICLHCGCSREIVERQMALLAPLNDRYKVYWNNRIDRHPETYDSYSELINHCVATSPTEHIIFINDRTTPHPHEVIHILELLEEGYAAATKYSVGFMGFTKELVRKIGWWDERYYGGGCEDDDFVLRLRLHNLAYYESLEGTYDMTWKTPLQPIDGRECAVSAPYFHSKWKFEEDSVTRVIKEQKYEKYEGSLGDSRSDISSVWKTWEHSKLGVFFLERSRLQPAGPSRTFHFMKDGVEFRKVICAFDMKDSLE
jgi:hypothetical protein